MMFLIEYSTGQRSCTDLPVLHPITLFHQAEYSPEIQSRKPNNIAQFRVQANDFGTCLPPYTHDSFTVPKKEDICQKH
jgi:hypothetical protein